MKKFARLQRGKKAVWCKVKNGLFYELSGSIYEDSPRTKKTALSLGAPHFLPPCEAQKVIGLAYNYKGLVGKRDRYDEPLFFFKSPTGLVGHNGYIDYPDFSDKVWIEGELVIVIGKKCKNVKESQAHKYILGFTCGNDVTCENILGRDWHLARSKGVDSFCPLGPYLVKGASTVDLGISSYINQKKAQESRTSDRILNDSQAVALISRFITLFPGDIIMTGTPAGARDAIVSRKDKVRIEIEDIGVLTNRVR